MRELVEEGKGRKVANFRRNFQSPREEDEDGEGEEEEGETHAWVGALRVACPNARIAKSYATCTTRKPIIYGVGTRLPIIIN